MAKNWRHILSWVYGMSRTVRFYVLLSALLRIVSIGCSLVFVLTSKELIDIVTGNSSASMTRAIVIFAASIVLQVLVTMLSSMQDTKNVVSLKNSLREKLFESFMLSAQRGKGHLQHSGDLTSRIIEDVRVLSNAVCTSIPSVITTGVQLLSAFGLMLFLEPHLAWILFFMMPVALLMSRVFAGRLRRLTHDIREVDSLVQSQIQESIQNHQQIKALDNTSYKQEVLNDLQQRLQEGEFKRLKFTLSSRTFVQLGFTAGYVTAFLWGIYGIQDGAVTFGMMTAFLQLVSQIQRPAVELSQSLPSFIHAYTSAERLVEIASLEREEQGEPIRVKGALDIRFRDVSFRYDEGEREVLLNTSLHFERNSLTALVGETGAGKSTIIKLILALIKPSKGEIIIGNENGESVDVSPLTRCNISYVPQGNSLLSGSVRDNLLLGRADATTEEMERALKTAAADFVFTLPNGIDTLCGERGVGLSEGQAQRIAIARGILRPSSILLLDEPTSSLDAETEKHLMQQLKEQLHDRCVVMISHQTTAIALADKVVNIKRNNL